MSEKNENPDIDTLKVLTTEKADTDGFSSRSLVKVLARVVLDQQRRIEALEEDLHCRETRAAER